MILAAVKSSFNGKLGLIYIYVLVVNVFVRLCTALALSIFIPSVIWFCDCSTMISFITLYLILFKICFQIYIVLSLAVFQLLIIKGKKKFVSYKTIGITLFRATVLAVILPIIFLARLCQTLRWGSCFISQYNRMCWIYCRCNTVTIVVNYCLFSNHWLGTLCLYFGGNDYVWSCAILREIMQVTIVD